MKNWGKLTCRMTSSYKACLTLSRPATSVHLTLDFSRIMAELSLDRSLACSGSSPSPLAPGFDFGLMAMEASRLELGLELNPSSNTTRISSALLKYSVNF